MHKQQSIRTDHSTAPKPAAMAETPVAPSSVEQRRWQVIALLKQHASICQIAAASGYSRYWVRVLVARYYAADPGIAVDRRRQGVGASALLSSALQHELAQALQASPPDGGPWTGPKVAHWMAARTGQPVHRQRGWEYLRRFGRNKAPQQRKEKELA